MLLKQAGYQQIESYDNGSYLLGRELSEEGPDLILIEVEYNSQDIHLDVVGYAFAEIARQQFPNAKIIVLTGSYDINSVRRAVKLQANGYILKNTPQANEELIIAVKRVLDGGRYYSMYVIESLLDAFSERELNDPSVPPYVSPRLMDMMEILSERQVEVMQLVARGLKNEEIADQMYISPKTVSAHKQNIIIKLDLKDTSELTKLAIQFFK